MWASAPTANGGTIFGGLMKQVLLSADGEISVYCVPDAVADDLETYCLEFSCHWLHESPDAARYRVKRGSAVVVCYTEKDFIEYLILMSF